MVADLVGGTDVYAKYAFPTPPIMGLVLYPFALLPGRWGMAAWFGFKSGLVVAMVWWLARMIREFHGRVPAWLVPLGVILGARPVIGDLLHGNVNLWILFLVLGGLVAYRSGRDAWAGLSLGLAAACKLTPGLVIVYFAWKRAWRTVLASLAALVLWLFLVPGAVLGFGHSIDLVASWHRRMVAPFVAEGQVDTEQVNQSLPALLHRMMTPSMAIKPDDGRPILQANVTTVSPSAVNALVAGAWVAVLVGLAWTCRTPEGSRREPRIAHELMLVLFATLILSERSWKHHFVVFLPSYVLLVVEAWRALARGEQGIARVIVGAIIFSTLALALTSKDLARPLLGPDGSKWMQVYGAYLWATAALAVAHGLVLARRRGKRLCSRRKRMRAANPWMGVGGRLAWFALVGAAWSGAPAARAQPTPTLGRSLGVNRSAAPPENLAGSHAVDPALVLLRRCKERFAKIRDYQATIVRQELVGKSLLPEQTIEAKFRCQPFSVYYKWLDPDAGKEWIFIEGQNDDKVLAHTTGFAKALTGVSKNDPDSGPAMKGTRQSVREAGIGRLIDRLLNWWEFERKFDRTEVEIRHMRMNGQPCYLVTTIHPGADDGTFRYHTLKVYIDKAEMLPIRVEAYAYPAAGKEGPGGLVEMYTFLDLKLNPGLSDFDFSSANPAYSFSRF